MLGFMIVKNKAAMIRRRVRKRVMVLVCFLGSGYMLGCMIFLVFICFLGLVLFFRNIY